MRDAIETLNKGANQQPNLSMIAMALSGIALFKYIFVILPKIVHENIVEDINI